MPDHAYLIMVAAVFLAVIGEFFRMAYHRKKSAGPIEKEVKSNLPEDNEYHNDFSKVPAGTIDPDSPIPRPRNFLAINPYKEFEEALKEDMENIGLEVKDRDKNS